MKPSFKKTRKFLDKIPSINRGGCGIAALAMYDAAKREGKKPKIVYLYSWMCDTDLIERNKRFKKGEEENAAACSHVVIKLGKKYWDSEGKVNLKNWKGFKKDEEISRKHLIASIDNVDEWNDCFNREKWVPKIQKFFKKGTYVEIGD